MWTAGTVVGASLGLASRAQAAPSLSPLPNFHASQLPSKLPHLQLSQFASDVGCGLTNFSGTNYPLPHNPESCKLFPPVRDRINGFPPLAEAVPSSSDPMSRWPPLCEPSLSRRRPKLDPDSGRISGERRGTRAGGPSTSRVSSFRLSTYRQSTELFTPGYLQVSYLLPAFLIQPGNVMHFHFQPPAVAFPRKPTRHSRPQGIHMPKVADMHRIHHSSLLHAHAVRHLETPHWYWKNRVSWVSGCGNTYHVCQIVIDRNTGRLLSRVLFLQPEQRLSGSRLQRAARQQRNSDEGIVLKGKSKSPLKRDTAYRRDQPSCLPFTRPESGESLSDGMSEQGDRK